MSARKSKLKRRAGDGDKNARRALELSANPNRFLATTQIGITLIGIITGAYGEASISSHVASWLGLLGWFAPYTRQVSSVLVVVAITFFSLIIGEIVPKRIGLAYPETIALLASRPMNKLSRISSPLVHILSATTDWILRLLRLKTGGEAIVEEEEIRHMIKEGAQHGVLDRVERDMLERTFQLADKKISSIMTVRKEIVWLQDDASEQTIKRLIKKHMHTHFPVCDGTLDSVIGVIRTDEVYLERYNEARLTSKNTCVRLYLSLKAWMHYAPWKNLSEQASGLLWWLMSMEVCKGWRQSQILSRTSWVKFQKMVIKSRLKSYSVMIILGLSMA